MCYITLRMVIWYNITIMINNEITLTIEEYRHVTYLFNNKTKIIKYLIKKILNEIFSIIK